MRHLFQPLPEWTPSMDIQSAGQREAARLRTVTFGDLAQTRLLPDPNCASVAINNI